MPMLNMRNLNFGYMPSFNTDLISEIKFAKKYFDFIEITLEYDLTKYSNDYLKRLKESLTNFEILGHIHWELDLTIRKDLKKIIENIRIYKFLGSKKITVHPFIGTIMNRKQAEIKNFKALKYISNLCKKDKIQLLIENSLNPLFNPAKGFKYLLTKNLSLLMTLDIGHAKGVSERELDSYLNLFSPKIKHIHLHYNCGKSDHLLFPKKQKKWLIDILEKLSKLNTKLTITLEMFAILKKQKLFPIDGKLRQNLLLNQLRFIKGLS